MLLNMTGFEWRYFTRQPSFYVTCLIFFLLPFLATVTEDIKIGGGGNVLQNGSFAITQTMLVLGVFAMFMVVNFIANTAIRNDSSLMAEIVYTKPIKPLQYQLGRFLGTYFITLTVFAMVPLGILIGSWMPWIDAERFGPTQLSFYLTTYFYFSLPTLFVLSAIFYAIAIRFKSMMSVYLSAVMLFILYSTTATFLDKPEYRTLAALFDPFAFNTFAELARYWTPHEKNTLVISFTDLLLYNRIIWLGFALVLLGLCSKLSTSLSLQTKTDKTSQSIEADKAPLNNRINVQSHQTKFSQQFWLRVKFEIKQVLFSAPFLILMLFSIFTLVMQLLDINGMYGTPNWPLTQTMVQLINNAFSLMIIIVITYYSAEAVWRERSSGMSDIIDSTPSFNLTFWLSKLISVCLVVICLMLIGMAVTIVKQLASGFNDIDISQYLISLLYFNALQVCLLVVLAFFCQIISPNKYIGMMIFVGYFFASMVFSELGLEHNMLNYGEAPYLQYSDMNGYGWFMITQHWFMLYWTAFAIVLSIVGYGLWHRGQAQSLRSRLSLLSYNMRFYGRVVLGIAMSIFIASGSVIYYNTTIINDFKTSSELTDLRVSYEKKYSQFENDELPTVTKVNINLDIYPAQRKLTAKAELTIENKSDQPISKFLVSIPQHTTFWKVYFEGGKISELDKKHRTAWYTFKPALQPGDTRIGFVKVMRKNRGFKNSDEDTRVLTNGTFINNAELLPSFGFNKGFKITDRHERRKHDLPELERANKLEDSRFYNESFFGKGIAFIDFETVISTSIDQTAIAPGYLQKQWQKNGRNYFHYKMDKPMVNFYSFLSAKLEVKKERYNDVNIEVYYHEDHDMNVDRMITATKDSLDYFTENFGPYQHKQMRIIEFPGYRSFAQSFANTVPYSEKIGFISDLRSKENIDPVYYVTAHEMAHQWWGHQVGAANVQGSAIISETLSQYSALMVMEKKYGHDKIRQFLTYELDSYLRGRATESREEMPLMRAENQSYIHYRKGSVVMMSLKDKLGEQHVNHALRNFLQQFKYQSQPYPTTLDLLAALKENTTAEQQAFIDSQFRDITIYDLRAKEVSIESATETEQQITFVVSGKRMTANGQGEESEQPLKEIVDIVAFANDPDRFDVQNNVVWQQKVTIVTGENSFNLTLPASAKYIAVDPFIKYIDRDTGDNKLKL